MQPQPVRLDATPAIGHTHLMQLFLLNLTLQLFDGVATYQGLQLGFGEANPLLAASFSLLGIGATLLLFKAMACGLLLLLYRHGYHPAVPSVLALLATAYGAFSFAPWMAKFLALALA